MENSKLFYNGIFTVVNDNNELYSRITRNGAKVIDIFYDIEGADVISDYEILNKYGITEDELKFVRHLFEDIANNIITLQDILCQQKDGTLKFEGAEINDEGDYKVGIQPQYWKIDGTFYFDTIDEKNEALAEFEKTFELFADNPKATFTNEV